MDPVLSTEEARELLGSSAKNMTDIEIEQLVYDLDVIAKYALQEAIKKHHVLKTE